MKKLSEDTYAQYVESYADTILRLAAGYCRQRSDAEDIVQEVFLKLYETDTCFTDAEHVKRWLIRVTVNSCKNHLSCAWQRRMQPMGFEELNLTLDKASAHHAWQFESASASALFQAVCDLPEKYRSIVHLYYYESYSVKEIARILQQKETAVQTRLLRARKMLKQKLKGAWQNET